MQAARSLVEQALSPKSTKSEAQSKPEKPEKLPQPLLDKLWLKMTEIYGRRWTGSFGVSADQTHAWAATLGGLTGAQIGAGLTALAETQDEQLRKWPPSAPEFRALCLEVPGLPTEDEAWEQALRGEYRHEAVKIAARATGTYDLRTAKLTDKALRQVFSRNYAIVKARAVMGKPLDGEIPKGIGYDQQTPMQAQYAHMHREARDLVMSQGIPMDGRQARSMLLSKLGIKREASHG